MNLHLCSAIYLFMVSSAIAGSWIDTKETGTGSVSSKPKSLDGSVANRIKPYLSMSAASYNDSKIGIGESSRLGYTPIEGKQNVHVKNNLMDFGLTYSVFENKKTGEVVFAFRGSVNASNFADDVLQVVASPKLTGSYREALVQIKNELKSFDTQKVVFTGHSLGGGLAQYVASEIKGTKAIAFNSAGLSVTGGYKPGQSYNIASVNMTSDPVSQSLKLITKQIGQEYLIDTGKPPSILEGSINNPVLNLVKFAKEVDIISNIAGSAIYDHSVKQLYDNVNILSSDYEYSKWLESKKEQNNNRTTQTANVITSQVSSLGSISFQPVYAVQPKAVNQPRILSSGGNTYTEGGWSVTYGLNSGLRQGVSGSELGLSTNNNGYTVISNEGAPFIYAQQTFKAGAGNNGTFNFESLAAFITKEQQRCAPCSTFGLDRAYITFISSTGQQVTKNLQEIYGVDKLGRVIFPNKVANGTLTTPLKQVVQSMQMAPGSTMKVIVNVNNSVNNDTLYPSSFAITNVRAK